MEFLEIFYQIKPIVFKCQKEYYIQLWNNDDWEQEGMIALYTLLEKQPGLENNKQKLLVYFKTKFRNHVLDMVRRQESQKRKFNRMPYEEVSEVGHSLYRKGLDTDDSYLLKEALAEYQATLDEKDRESYQKLLANERFKGRKQVIRNLQKHLAEWEA